MSPEQYIDAEACDIRSDIYSLGVTLYYLAAGRLPFETQTRSELRHMHLSVEPVVPSTFVPDIPIDFDYIVLHCIQKNPDDRYHTPDELLADLEAFLAGQPLPSTTRGAVPVVHMQANRTGAAKTWCAWFLPAVAAVLVLLILCLAGMMLLTNRQRQKQTPSAGPLTGENDFEFTGQDAAQKELTADDMSSGVASAIQPVRPSTKALDDAEISIVDKETDAQAASYFEDAKQRAEQAIKAGTGYQNAIDDLESFTASDEYSIEALGVILELKKASEASVKTLMDELDELAAPLIREGNYDAAIILYDRHEKIEPLKQESLQSRNDKKRELERMKQNNAPDGDPAEEQPPASEPVGSDTP